MSGWNMVVGLILVVLGSSYVHADDPADAAKQAAKQKAVEDAEKALKDARAAEDALPGQIKKYLEGQLAVERDRAKLDQPKIDRLLADLSALKKGDLPKQLDREAKKFVDQARKQLEDALGAAEQAYTRRGAEGDDDKATQLRKELAAMKKGGGTLPDTKVPELLPKGTVLEGTFKLRPPGDYQSEIRLTITGRSGDSFEAKQEDKFKKTILEVKGTVKKNNVEWQYTRAVKGESGPEMQRFLNKTKVSGTIKDDTIEAVQDDGVHLGDHVLKLKMK